MWPKAFAQLIELAPHVSRLLPMADRFFQSKTAGDDANRKAIEALAESFGNDLEKTSETIRADVRAVAASHSAFEARLTDLGDRIDAIAPEIRSIKLSTAFIEQRLRQVVTRETRLFPMLVVALVLLFAVLVLLILLYVRCH